MSGCEEEHQAEGNYTRSLSKVQQVDEALEGCHLLLMFLPVIWSCLLFMVGTSAAKMFLVETVGTKDNKSEDGRKHTGQEEHLFLLTTYIKLFLVQKKADQPCTLTFLQKKIYFKKVC